MKVIEGTEITLPTPENRPNYTFEGWYVGNTKVSSPYVVTDDVTLVAQWRYIGQGGGSSSSSGDYSISVDADKHGTVTVSPKRATRAIPLPSLLTRTRAMSCGSSRSSGLTAARSP